MVCARNAFSCRVQQLLQVRAARYRKNRAKPRARGPYRCEARCTTCCKSCLHVCAELGGKVSAPSKVDFALGQT